MALGVVADPVLAAQVTAIVQQPVGTERPSLLHFAVAGGHPPGSRRPPGPRAPGRLPAAIAIAAVAIQGSLVAGALLLPLRRRPRWPAVAWRLRRLPRRANLIAGFAATASAVAMVLLGTVGTGAAFRTVVASVPLAPSPPRVSPTPVHLVAAEARRLERLGPWIELVGLEQRLSASRDDLARQERSVSDLTQKLQARAVAAATDPQAAAELQTMVASYQAGQAAYENSLQLEYQFYVGAVQNPQQRAALAAAAASAPGYVRSAVMTDLDAVQAQTSQEAAIAAAESQAAAAPAALPAPAPAAPAVAPGRPAPAPPAHGTAPAVAAPGPGGLPPLTSPMGGEITQGFGATQYSFEPPVTVNGQFYPHFHTGLDISAPLDSAVRAAGAGTVLLATSSLNDQGRLVGYGNYVVIAHGRRLVTVYGHLDRLLVQPGQQLNQGDVIGLEGSTGNSTGPHLHFETRLDGYWTDPLGFLGSLVHP